MRDKTHQRFGHKLHRRYYAIVNVFCISKLISDEANL